MLETAIVETLTCTQTQCRTAIQKIMICNKGLIFTTYFLFYLTIGNILNMQYKITSWKNKLYLLYINFIPLDTIQNIKLKKWEYEFDINGKYSFNNELVFNNKYRRGTNCATAGLEEGSQLYFGKARIFRITYLSSIYNNWPIYKYLHKIIVAVVGLWGLLFCFSFLFFCPPPPFFPPKHTSLLLQIRKRKN